MTDLIIRDAVPEDFSICERWESSLHQMHAQARPDLFRATEHPLSLSEFMENLGNSQRLCLIAEIEGVPAGMCSITLRPAPASPLLLGKKSAHVEDLFVEPSFRGRGVASALIREGEFRSRAWGAKSLSLLVWPFNQEAVRFYEHMGMQVRNISLEKKL